MLKRIGKIGCLGTIGLVTVAVIAAAATGTGEGDAVPTKLAARPAPYDVVAVEDASTGIRARVTLRIVVPDADGLSEDERIATMAAALEDAFAGNPGADAALVFAYHPGADTESVATFGRASASRDGKGWDGEGKLIGLHPDGGTAAIGLFAHYDAKLGIASGEEIHRVKLSIRR